MSDTTILAAQPVTTSATSAAPMVATEMSTIDPAGRPVIADESVRFTIDDPSASCRLVLSMPARAVTTRTVLRRSYRDARRQDVSEREARRLVYSVAFALAGESIGWHQFLHQRRRPRSVTTS